MSAEQRRLNRKMMVVKAAMLVRSKLGSSDTRELVEEVRVAALASVAECRGLWDFLVARGLATQAQREDFLDRGYAQLLGHIEAATQNVFVEGRGNA